MCTSPPYNQRWFRINHTQIQKSKALCQKKATENLQISAIFLFWGGEIIDSFKIIDDDGVCVLDRRVTLRQHHRHHHRTNRMWLTWMIAAMMFAIVIVVDVDLVSNDLEAVSVSAFLPYFPDRVRIWNTFPRTLTAFLCCKWNKKSIENKWLRLWNEAMQWNALKFYSRKW